MSTINIELNLPETRGHGRMLKLYTAILILGCISSSFASSANDDTPLKPSPSSECIANEKTSTQYNTMATDYSETFLSYNIESIEVYFRYLDMDLKGKKVLDLGCGDGYDLSRIKASGALISGVDSSEEMVRIASQKNPDSTVKIGRFDKIPFPDQTFDLVISKWALQTTDVIDPIYKEIARVLKPGGGLVYLTSHPIRQFIEKKRKKKDYFQKEIVTSTFFDGKITANEPSHTLNEYFSKVFFSYFILESYEEGYDRGAEKVDGDIYPSYFIIKASLKNSPTILGDAINK